MSVPIDLLVSLQITLPPVVLVSLGSGPLRQPTHSSQDHDGALCASLSATLLLSQMVGDILLRKLERRGLEFRDVGVTVGPLSAVATSFFFSPIVCMAGS